MKKNIFKFLILFNLLFICFIFAKKTIFADVNITKSMVMGKTEYNSSIGTRFVLNQNITIQQGVDTIQRDDNNAVLIFNDTTDKTIIINGQGHTIRFSPDRQGNYPSAKRLVKVIKKSTNQSGKKLKVYFQNIRFVGFKVNRSGAVVKAGGSYVSFSDCYFEHCYVKNPVLEGDDTGNDFGGGAVFSTAKETGFWGCGFNDCFLWDEYGNNMKGGAVKIFDGEIARFGGGSGLINPTAHYCSFNNCRTYPIWDNNIYVGDNSTDCNGGAIHINDATTYISGGTFTKNRAGDAGGAIHCTSSKEGNNVPTLCIGYSGGNTYFSENTCSTSVKDFNSVYTGGGAINTKNFDLDIGTIRPNSAYENGFNVIDTWNNRASMRSNVTFYKNKSYTAGGALYLSAGTNGYGKSRIVANFIGNNNDNNEAAIGGAIYAQGSSHGEGANYLGIFNSKFSYCETMDLVGGQSRDNSGGAIYSGQKLDMYNTTLEENTAYQNNGGAISLTCPSANTSGCGGTIDCSVIKNNYAADNGGGIYTNYDLVTSIWGTTYIQDNYATNGGGLAISSRAQADLGYDIIKDNYATNGGGIYNWGRLNLNSTYIPQISNNTAINCGGGISNASSGSICHKYGEIKANSSKYGGGIYNSGRYWCHYEEEGTTVNQKIINNTSSSDGGGFYNSSSGKVDMQRRKGNGYLTISNNYTGGNGAGIYNDGTINKPQDVNISLYCGNNTAESQNKAEFYNASNGKAILTGGDTVKFDGDYTILGSSTSGLYALTNNGTVNLIPGGNSSGFFIKSKADYTILNNKTLNIVAGNKPSHIESYGHTAILNTNNGTINCNNSPAHLIINGRSDRNEYGINNKGVINDLKASIGLQNSPFNTGVYNEKTINGMTGQISYCTNHGIWNKDKIIKINSLNIDNNSTFTLSNGGGLFADSNSNTIFENSNKIQNNSTTTNGGGIYASDNANVQISGSDNIIQNNTAQNGGGIYAGEHSKILLGTNNSNSKTIQNRLINNYGTGNNIYIDSYAQVRDFSTYHRVNKNQGLGSVYVTGANANSNQTEGRGVYEIGCATLYDTFTDSFPAYIYLNAGTYIDIVENLQSFVTKDNTDYASYIYVMTNDATKKGTTNNRSSEVGRIIANNNTSNNLINELNNGNPRFKHIMTGTGGSIWNGVTPPAKKVSYSKKLNNKGKNNLFTNAQAPINGTIKEKNTNENLALNNNDYLNKEYSNNEDKNKQVFLTETYNINYIGALPDKVNELTQEQLNSITGYSNIGSENNVQINNKTVGRATVEKYWYEDINITYLALSSNFGKFDNINSWQTENGTKYARGTVYALNTDLTIYAVWSNTTKILISHYLMSQIGEYDIDSDYTDFTPMYYPENGEFIYGGLFGSSYQGTYKGISAYYNHSGFETWHQITTIEATQDLTEDYITNNLLDNNLIKENISKYSYYEIVQNNDTNSMPIIKIFYEREKYRAEITGDNGISKVGYTQERVYSFNYTANDKKTSISLTSTEPIIGVNNSGHAGYWGGEEPLDNNEIISASISEGAKIYLKKGHTYEFNIPIEATSGPSGGFYIYKEGNSQANQALGGFSGVEGRGGILGTYTPASSGVYQIIFAGLSHNYWFNSNLTGTITAKVTTKIADESMEDNISEGVAFEYWAIDKSETRLQNNIIAYGEKKDSCDFIGTFESKNEKYTFTKLNNTEINNNESSTVIQLPNYGNVYHKITTSKNTYNLNLDKMLEKQSGEGFDQLPYGLMPTYGLVKIKDLKNVIKITENQSDVIDEEKTIFSYMYDFPGNNDFHIYDAENINNLNENDYLPSDKGYLKLYVKYYRKTFTIKAIAGTNATAAAISSDNFENQPHSQSQITERYYLNANNPFNLPAETKKTIYLDGQIKDGYSGSWTSNYDRYNTNYGYKLNQVKTDVPILENLDVTFTLSAGLKRNITIYHYLMDTDGIYQLQEDYTQVLTNTSLASIVPDDYKNSGSNKETNLEYIKDGVKYRYLHHAEYAGDNYTNLNNSISLSDYDKDAEIKLFYDRVRVPVYIYANQYIDNIKLYSNSFRDGEGNSQNFTYENGVDSINNGKLMNASPLYAYFEEVINLSSQTVNIDEGEDISFDGYTFGKCNFNSEDLECTTQNYKCEVGTVNRLNISVYGHSEPWKWHIYYHENCKDDEYNCGHEKHMSENDVGMNAGYTNDDKIVDILWNDTINAEGEMFVSDSSHKQIKWETNNGKFINFNDVLSRSDLNELIDSDSRTIDLYAVWKNTGPKVNIYAEDLYFEVGTDISQDDILKKIHVSDENGKILSNSESDLGVVRIEVDNRYEDRLLFPEGSEGFSDTNLSDSDFDNYINSDNATTYLITVKASKEDVVTYKTYKVIIYENLIGKTYIRAIDKEMLGSLSINSIWRQPNNYARLIKTLNKGRSNSIDKDTKEAKYVFAFNSNDLLDIQAKIKANGYKYKDVIKDENIKKEPEDE